MTTLYDCKEIETATACNSDGQKRQALDITILWFALNKECKAMARPEVQRLYIAYSFLGRDGAELETPVSLPKPKDCTEKCYFNFKKSELFSSVKCLATALFKVILRIRFHVILILTPQKGTYYFIFS